MSPAFKVRSRSLFSAAVALSLGLQVAPWPTTLQAQGNGPAPLVVGQGKAQPIIPVARRNNQRRNNSSPNVPQSIQPPALQPMPQPGQQQAGSPQFPKSDVQRELEKLYQQNGQPLPEMVDPRTSQPYANQPQGAPSNAPQQVMAQPQAQPAYQPSQPAQPVATPKRKGLLEKFFSKNNGPTQPPVEPPYTPPKAAVAVTPPAVGSNVPSGTVQSPQYYGQLINPSTGTNPSTQPQQLAPQLQAPVVMQAPVLQPAAPESVAVQPALNVNPPANVVGQNPPSAQIPVLAPTNLNQIPASNSAVADEGFDSPIYTEAPATAGNSTLPSIDFNAPLEQPVLDQVHLGEPAPLAGVAASTEPADPFSDAALFPGTEASAPSVAAAPENPGTAVEPDAVTPDMATSEETATAEPAPVDENPYSGLTLDADPFANPETLKVAAAPREIPQDHLATATSAGGPPALLVPNDGATAESEEPPLVVDQPDSDQRPLRLEPSPRNERTRAKQEMIAARKGLKGLKGFCPVVLREDRDLVDAHSQFRAVYNSKTYYLSSSQAVSAFHADPAKYAPAARGSDVIHLAITGEEIEGSLDHAVWYKGRLYLFASAETMDTFVSAPSSHATLD